MEYISIIYKLLVLHLLTGEANSMLSRVGLENYRISSPAELTDVIVFAPKAWNFEMRGFDGNVQTTNLTFSLTCGGEHERFGLACLHTLPGRGRIEDWHDRDGKVRVPGRSVSDRAAYGLARGWLERLGFNVAEMEKANRPRVRHLRLPPAGRGLVSSRFLVRWGGAGAPTPVNWPVAEVQLNETENWPVRITVQDLRYYARPLPRVPHAIAVSLLPNEPVLEFLRVHGISLRSPEFTNVFSLLTTTREYEAALQGALLKECSEILASLGCHELAEPKAEDLTDLYVNPPAFGPGGRLEFRNGEMQFDSKGKLGHFSYLPREQTNYYFWLSTQKSVISSNEACQIALSGMAALSIDVAGLDRDCERKFYRGQFYKLRTKDHARIWFETPEYYFEWHGKSAQSKKPVAKIVVYGDIRQIGKIELTDTRYWTRQLLAPPVRR